MNKKEITAEIYRKYFEIVPKGHHNCQLSIINCQFNIPSDSQQFPGISAENGFLFCL